MPHRREQIRDAVVTLVTGLPTTGANVTAAKAYLTHLPTLPSLNVNTLAEDRAAEEAVMGTRPNNATLQVRALALTIEIRAAGDNAFSQLDDIALEIETAVSADITLGGLAKKMTYTGFEAENSGEFEQPVSLMTMAYQVDYRVDPNDPQ